VRSAGLSETLRDRGDGFDAAEFGDGDGDKLNAFISG
jgi:hypothetical protein